MDRVSILSMFRQLVAVIKITDSSVAVVNISQMIILFFNWLGIKVISPVRHIHRQA